MRCFRSSYSEKKGVSFKHRLTWNFFSQSSSASSLDLNKSRPHAVSEPMPDGRSECPPSLPLSSSQRAPNPRVFTFVELRAATNNFSDANLLGEGGFGCVYKGLLKGRDPEEEDMEIAVKKLDRNGQQGHKEWLAEVRYLGLVEHPNLVKLVGYCAEDDDRGIQRLLVYEYMPNGSLENHLFHKVPSVLSWQQRLSVMLGAARGLAYLHEEIEDLQVIFRDFKTSNVLLDRDFTSKLSDFGLARQGPEMGATHVSTAVVGTLGYAAPEYIQTGHLTSKSDVWSFGVVLLEILTGRRALDRNRPKDEQQLIDWVKLNLHGNKRIHLIMDPRLEGKYSVLHAQKISSLAFQCLEKQARARPSMRAVVKSLGEIVDLVECTHPQGGGGSILSTQSSGGMKNVSIPRGSKKRELLYKDVMSLKSKEDARNMWRDWTPKAVAT